MKKYSRAFAFLLTLTLILAFPVASLADTADEGTIGGGSTVEDVVLNVLLPTSLNFALDPLSLTETNNQVKPADYFFVNMTLAPVKISLDITAETSGDAILVDDPDGLSPDDPAVTDKELYFAALGATGVSGDAIDVTSTAITSSAVIASSSGIYAYTSPGAALVDLAPSGDGTTGAAVIAFALDKAAEGSTTGAVTLAEDNAGVAVFQFYGVLNTYADWQDGDLAVSGSYTLTPLRTSTYDGAEFIADGLNQLVTAPPAPSTYSITVENDGNGTATADVSTAAAGDTVTLSATPTGSYVFDAWEAVSPSSLTITGDTFTMPAEDVTVRATFTQPYGGIAGFISGSATSVTYSGSTLTAHKQQGTNLTIPFYAAGKSIASITMNGTYPLVSGTDYSYNASTNTLSLISTGASGTGILDVAGSAGVKNFVLKLTGDSANYAFAVTIQIP